ncbi:hypothetical protein ACGFQG_27895 [Nocardia fluminea]|uniref:hypothetical protein n=1 Tax=Nocardia fluminea TaxID=134984 RepID=UPI0037143969
MRIDDCVGEAGDSVTIGVLADPDLPTRLAHSLRADLPGEFERVLGERVSWQEPVNGDPFEAMYPDNDRLIDRARDYVGETSWDLALCVTDLPLRDARGVLVAVVDPAAQVALISQRALRVPGTAPAARARGGDRGPIARAPREVGKGVFFGALYLLALAAVALVVSPDYLATTRGRPSDLGDY